MATDPRVDEYIANAPAFEKPILEHLRNLIHKSCPDIVETIKWSRPAFLKRDKILFGMSGFKAHCSFYVFHPDVAKLLKQKGSRATDAASLDRITDLSQLPSPQDLVAYIREAANLLDQVLSDPSPRKRTTAPKSELEVPEELTAALAKNKTAKKAFEGFSPSHRREYIEWIGEAKREETRQKRIATALGWLTEGKPRNWKYMNC